MCGRLDAYLLSFSNLSTKKDKQYWGKVTKYRSPEKPLLLIGILHLISSGDFLRNFFTPTDSLSELYNQMFNMVPQPREPNIIKPFVELNRSIFWDLRPKNQHHTKKPPIPSTPEQFKLHYFGACFSEDLYILLQMNHSRSRLLDALITHHFDESMHTPLHHPSGTPP